MCWTTAACARSSSTNAPPSVNLLESLIGKLANRLMQLPGVLGVRVKIAKLEILTTAKWRFAWKRGSGKPMNAVINPPSHPTGWTDEAEAPQEPTANAARLKIERETPSWKSACAARSARPSSTST